MDNFGNWIDDGSKIRIRENELHIYTSASFVKVEFLCL